jgi:parallel beta-helix repeat protein
VRADREIGSVAGAATRVALIGAGKFRIGRHAGERFECALQGFLEHARDPEAASRKGHSPPDPCAAENCLGAGPGVQAQNGIQIGSSGALAGTHATVTNNTISGLGVTGDPANGVGSAVLTFNAGASVTVEDNTITGSPNYGVAFINTESPVATGNTISSTTSAIIDAGTFTTPVTHASNVFVGNNVNLDLEASGTAAHFQRVGGPRSADRRLRR